MHRLTADDLCSAPRGVRLCVALAHRLQPAFWSSLLHASWHPSDSGLQAEAARVLADVDASPVRDWTDPLAFADAMDESVSTSMGWQPSDEIDAFARHPELRTALRPVAEAVVSSPAARWWNEGIALETQRHADRFDDEDGRFPPSAILRQAITWSEWRADVLRGNAEAERDRPQDPAAPYSGHWWSTPSRAGVLTTSRALPGLGAVELVWEEDSFGARRADIRPARAVWPPRVLELDCPAAWADLVRRYPLDLTAEHRHDWYAVTGRDGVWHAPDWAAVARDHDAVHLSVTGWLTTANRLVRVDDRVATVLAGWDPDQTWWLDSGLLEVGDPEPWAFDDVEERWRPEGG